MTMIQYKPLGLRNRDHLFRSFFDDMNSWMDGLPTQTSDFVPVLDVKENETNYTVTAELAGMDEKDIDLSFKDGVLSIRGEKKIEDKKEDESHLCIERSYGSFQRSMTIPTSIDEKAVQASFKNGLLTITLPKKIESEQVHKIKIQS